MKFKKFIIACGLVAIATILCWLGSAKISSKDEPKRIKKIVFAQETSMVDFETSKQVISAKIEAKKALVVENRDLKTEFRETARAEYEAYLAELARQRRAAQAAQVTYSEPTTSVESSSVQDGYLGTYKCTGYVATGNTCANGNYPTSGYTIASNSLPIGTRVYIEGIGERVVEDTGGMANNVIDVFVDSTSEAYSLTGNYEVYIVE